MTKQADKTGPSPSTATAEELVLPDESDRIISDLRSQLDSLQQQLSIYRKEGAPGPKSAAGAGGRPPAAGAPDAKGRDWSGEWAPEVADRLRGPAQDLTSRLERLIDQVQDPGLRQELELCLETAFYLFATFRHISDNHRLLMQSLEEEKAPLDLGALRDRLRAELGAQGMAVTPETEGNWSQFSSNLPQSLVSVTTTVARIAAELVGKVIRVTLTCERALGGRAPRDGICITVACAGARDDLRTMDNAAQLVFKPGVSAITVVDWLYMEKIVELQGGSLRLYHRGDRAAGFQVRIPLELAREASDAESRDG